jgi:two-component system sensor histidine kinase DegS
VPADAGAAPTAAAPANAPSGGATPDHRAPSNASAQSDRGAPETAAQSNPQVTSAADFATHLANEAAAVKAEVDEIELLINQAKTEAARHETRRSAAAEKLGMAAERAAAGGNATGKELADLANQLVTVARKAALMEAQVDLLEGKRKSALRLAETLAAKADEAKQTGVLSAGTAGQTRADGDSNETASVPGFMDLDLGGPLPPGVSRVILTAQEDLRREISRQMHDGPAQSLTNIVLQAQIVERLLTKDPALAQSEVHLLIGMVQQTLEATKSFIFDVRPMVLDDLGLVPTLRRAARDRGRRAAIAVEFESIGADRRLPVELESGLFRILDEALAGYLSAAPDRVSLRLDWSDIVEARVIARRAGDEPLPEPEPEAPAKGGKDVPPALAAMMEQQRADERAAAERRRKKAVVVLPADAWREIQERAATIGATVELAAEGGALRVTAAAPEVEPATTD